MNACSVTVMGDVTGSWNQGEDFRREYNFVAFLSNQCVATADVGARSVTVKGDVTGSWHQGEHPRREF